ncbi:telomerase reverse transcriptase [Pyrenophora tritici-repentis]|uniref:Telomerase reverse transcriptase n=1 Tax=Pyrenophora tritici-repentis TaxID=45151 RepID=A0A2W1GNJ4_9PLEO|nr:Telomerase ribonucleoprotein complex - RNA binding domain containing protein [Pyrenophora tritici-repentis]PZD04856.1 telomerase reverse transcriptase [Pyrenophora tritici-repentis]PZD35952.1 telomerase reverse transcriptase [Pyrenophora tritici-repentis]PZD47159.1 telomerase reverse transcriptase [Pyrenophora tritici-repentis]
MKRKRSDHASVGSRKLPKHASATPPSATHPVLQRLYPQVLTLRCYLLSRLPKSSKSRHRKISQLGRASTAQDPTPIHPLDTDLADLLDSALVGSLAGAEPEKQAQVNQERDQDIDAFTQQRSQGTPGGTYKPGHHKQSEIVNSVIYCLFKRSPAYKPNHLLCHGFQKTGNARREQDVNHDPCSSIPGLQECQRNNYMRTLKEPVWCRLHALIGEGGDRIMRDMLLDCSIFLPIKANAGNYYQLSGVPISDIKSDYLKNKGAEKTDVGAEATTKPINLHSDNKAPGSITFVRSRMLYAKAALNAKGDVRFGMRHIHVLNRYSDQNDKQQTVHIMRYIFPRQFGLHNVFTSKVDFRETAMPFKDYTLREKEIHSTMCRELGKNATNPEHVARWKLRTPKRLRGDVMTLVEKLRVLNQRCSYMEMLRHYCPIDGVMLSPKPEWRKASIQSKADSPTVTAPAKSDGKNPLSDEDRTGQQTSFTDMASPTAHVSAFCRAVISKVIPKGFWGDDHNQRALMYWVDQFVDLRRFESLTLHRVTQKIHITAIAWLQLPNQNSDSKLSKSDIDKRTEVFMEFVYWLFDSFLVPLIRTNFHVTESNVHRNRLFYFRHDVWRMLTEPALRTLRLNMFEEMPTEDTLKLLSLRPLGFSSIRLLPKKQGFRTIMNLKKRQQVVRYGTMTLGRSINSVMTPAFNAITYEKSLRPDRFGCSLFSVGDMFPKLLSFKASLRQRGLGDTRLYFAKVDVQACFDTIPQSRLLRMIDSLMSNQAYYTGKHVEMFPLGPLQRLNGEHDIPMPRKKYVAHSRAATDMKPFDEFVKDRLVGAKANTVFVNTSLQQCETKDNLMQLLREHVERNIVKIGKRFYRQKTGIPQGSVLSSILCNYFYAELERDVLGFALGDDCLLLRLLDDFLLITINEEHAKRFVHVMHKGHAEYGVVIKPEKSLTNFEVTTDDGVRVPKTGPGERFPYCGISIDMATLEVGKKTERSTKAAVEDSLTVDLSKIPGQTFHRKALNAFKIQLKAMLIDTCLNSVAMVLANLYQSFYEAAVRCLEYTHALSKVRTTCSSVLIKTVDNIIALAYVMLQRRARLRGSREAKIAQGVISRRQLQW